MIKEELSRAQYKTKELEVDKDGNKHLHEVIIQVPEQFLDMF